MRMFRIISLVATFIFSAILIAGISMGITTKGELGALLVVIGILGACASAMASTLTFSNGA